MNTSDAFQKKVNELLRGSDKLYEQSRNDIQEQIQQAERSVQKVRDRVNRIEKEAEREEVRRKTQEEMVRILINSVLQNVSDETLVTIQESIAKLVNPYTQLDPFFIPFLNAKVGLEYLLKEYASDLHQEEETEGRSHQEGE